MTKNKNINHLTGYQKELKFIVNSEVRLKILFCLSESPSTMKEITEKTGLSYSSVSGNINEMKKQGFIKVDNNVLYLLNDVKIKLSNIDYFNRSINTILNGSEYLNTHKVGYNELSYLMQLTDTESFELIHSTPENVDNVIETMKDYLVGTTFVKAIIPFLLPEYDSVIHQQIENQNNVEFIIEEPIKEKIINASKKMDIKNDFKIKTLKKPVDLILIISDKGICLSFYKNDGNFDSNSLLISQKTESVKWGIKLFKDYEQKQNEYINLKDLKMEVD